MVYLSVGSNLGNRINNIRKSFELIKSLNILSNIKHSIILETEAILPKDAPRSWNIPYLNMVISGEASVKPKALLTKLKEIELSMGRSEHHEKWSPRIVDLDILLFDDLAIDTRELKIPHLELKNRPFFQNLLSLMGVEIRYSDKELRNLNNASMNSFIKSFVLNPPLVGVVNLTQDSFSDGGKFDCVDYAVKQIAKLISHGASVIELGAQSTRPNAKIVGEIKEYNKLNEVLLAASDLIKEKNIQISIDSFWSSVILKLLKNNKINFINDVKGEFNDKTLIEIAANGCKLCAMHSLSAPVNPEIVLSQELDPLKVLKDWGREILRKMYKLGFSRGDVVIDPGIGFGKIAYQNIRILKMVEKLRTLEAPIMIGHSRKSYINRFSNFEAKDRDIETIAVSGSLFRKVDFLRVHNVEDHMRFLSVYETFLTSY